MLFAYKYDHNGKRRLKVKKSNGETTSYINQFYTVKGRTEPTKHIFLGKTRIVSLMRVRDNQGQDVDFEFYYHPDHIGSTNFVSQVTKVSGQSNKTYSLYEHVEYMPFGETFLEQRKNDLPVADTANKKRPIYLFTSKEFDSETELYYYGARYYDPRTSVWQSPDHILAKYLTGKPNGEVYSSFNLNLYSYTHQNPVKLVDPSGKYPNKKQAGNLKELIDFVKKTESEIGSKDSVFSTVYHHFRHGEGSGNKIFRYIYTEKAGWIDLKHFFEAAKFGKQYGDLN